MSRIDVLPAEKKGKFRVLVNFVQHGVEFSSCEIANHEAVLVREKHYPQATLFPFVSQEKK